MFRVFYWGVATAVKVMIIGLMYIAAYGGFLYGMVSIIWVGQFCFGFSTALFGNSEWPILIGTFGGGALYIALLCGVASVILKLAAGFIAWGFRDDAQEVVSTSRRLLSQQ